jgi:hypothetical protein
LSLLKGTALFAEKLLAKNSMSGEKLDKNRKKNLMLKFELNHLEKTLFIQNPGSPRQAITKTFTGNYQAQGFILEPSNH